MENEYIGKFCFDPKFLKGDSKEKFKSIQNEYDPSARLQVQSWKKEIDDAIK